MKKSNLQRIIALGTAALLSFSLSACTFGRQQGPINQSSHSDDDNNDTPEEPADTGELPEVDINDLPAIGESAPDAEDDSESSTVKYANDWTYSWIVREDVERHKYEDDWSHLLVSVEYQKLHLSEEAKEKYPDLAVSVEIADDIIATENENLYIANCNGLNNLTEEDKNSRIMDFGCVRGDDSDIYVRRSSGGVLSFVNLRNNLIAYEFADYSFMGFNYDIETGKSIELTDFVSDTDALYELVAQKACDQKMEWEKGFWGEASDVDMDALIDSVKNAVSYGGGAWTLDNQGVTFYFRTGYIGYTYMQVQVLFAEDKDGRIFNGKYGEPDTWTVYVIDNVHYQFTNDDSGKINSFLSYGYEETDYYRYNEYLVYNGKNYTEEYEADNVKHVLAHKDGDTWLYMFYSEYWTSMLDIFELTDDGVFTSQTNKNLAMAAYPDGINHAFDRLGYYAVPVFTDMDNIIFERRTDILSTCLSNIHYSTERDGSLYMLDEYYNFTEETQHELTTVIDLPDIPVVDKAGNETGEYVDIPTGSILKMIRTDGDKNVDFETQNGELIRLEIVSGKDYGSAYGRGIIVSGEYVEQYNVFEVLMFAQ